MEIVLIVGKSDAGKSTLVRHLSGLRNCYIGHANPTWAVKNIAALNWAQGSTGMYAIERTLCLHSSINEVVKIAPECLKSILDGYQNNPACTRAILCVSLTKLPRIVEYAKVINAVGFGHQVKHTVYLSADNTPAIAPQAGTTFQNVKDHWVYRNNQGTPPNQVSADVKTHIGLA